MWVKGNGSNCVQMSTVGPDQCSSELARTTATDMMRIPLAKKSRYLLRVTFSLQRAGSSSVASLVSFEALPQSASDMVKSASSSNIPIREPSQWHISNLGKRMDKVCIDRGSFTKVPESFPFFLLNDLCPADESGLDLSQSKIILSSRPRGMLKVS